jgi:ATP-dependent DNA helicase RecQ
MLLGNIIRKDIEEYGLLKFTEAGVKFMKKPTSFKIVLNNLFEEANADDDEGEGGGTGAAADERLFEMLKELRQKKARKRSCLRLLSFLKHRCRIWQPCIQLLYRTRKMPGRKQGKSD